MRDPAPPYVGEGPPALWHVSENPSIERFEPHASATASSREPRVWAVDTRHLPLYWFPRECPRGTFWATLETTPRGCRAPRRSEPRASRRERHGCRRCAPPASSRTGYGRRRSNPIRRSAATGSVASRWSRSTSSSSATSCSGTSSRASSSGSSRISGRPGTASSSRPSSSAAFACTTQCRRRRS